MILLEQLKGLLEEERGLLESLGDLLEDRLYSWQGDCSFVGIRGAAEGRCGFY